MLEMLVSMCVICALLLLSLNNNKNIDLSNYEFMNKYLEVQSQSILNSESNCLSNGVSFNSLGHVNQARTIEFNNHKVIVHLGSGYLTYE